MVNLKTSSGIDSVEFGKNIIAEPGTILMFAGSTAPSGWFMCDGTTFSTANNPVLFSILGSSSLPNLKSRYAIGKTNSASIGQLEGNTLLSQHSHNATYTTINSNNVNVDGSHGHSAFYNSNNSNYSNQTHGHYYSLTVNVGYSFNNGNRQGTNQGNLTSPGHTHAANWYGYYGRNVNSNHAHGMSNVNATSATYGLSHSHSISATTENFPTNVSTDLSPRSKEMNFIIKGG